MIDIRAFDLDDDILSWDWKPAIPPMGLDYGQVVGIGFRQENEDGSTYRHAFAIGPEGAIKYAMRILRVCAKGAHLTPPMIDELAASLKYAYSDIMFPGKKKF